MKLLSYLLFIFFFQVLGDVKNLAIQLFLLRMRHEEKINKLGFPMSSKALLALPFPSKDAYGIPKKKLAAIINAKKAMDFSGEYIHQNGGMETRESSPEFMVDELNFCKLYLLYSISLEKKFKIFLIKLLALLMGIHQVQEWQLIWIQKLGKHF